MRTTISPTSPTGTSQSFPSTSRTSTPVLALPHAPAFLGLASETTGVEISVMLKSVYTSTPKRPENSSPFPASGTRNASLRGWSPSSAVGGRFVKNPAITPKRNTAVLSVSLTDLQKVSVSNSLTIAIDPPRQSIA